LNLNDPIFVLRSLKGCPLSIVFAMFLLRRPLGVEALTRETGWSKGSVEDGLDALRAMGLVVKTSRYNGWQLTNKGYQLPLFDQDNFPQEGEAGEVEEPVTGESQGNSYAPRASENLRLPAEASPEAWGRESQNLRLESEDQPQQMELTAAPAEIESQNLRLNLKDNPEVGDQKNRESQNLRLPGEKEGAEGQEINVESQNLRLDEPLVGTHGTHDVLKHDDDVLKNLDSLKHHHESGTSTPAHEEAEVDPEELETVIQAAAKIFWEAGHTLPNATRLATNLVNQYGAERVRRQVDFFPDRVGLEKPGGAFTASVKFDWPPQPKPKDKAWYTEEEFKRYIDH
jgi:biotin operon repressor